MNRQPQPSLTPSQQTQNHQHIVSGANQLMNAVRHESECAR